MKLNNLKTIIILPYFLIVFMACNKEVQSDLKISSGAIVGGEIVKPGDNVSRSSVSIFTSKFDGSSSCSGVLISEDIVLTAAHCFTLTELFWDLSGIEVGFGVGHNDKGLTFKHKILITDVISRSFPKEFLMLEFGYTFSDLIQYQKDESLDFSQYDIALIKLAKKAPKEYKPVSIVDHNFKLNPNDKLIITGSGKTSLGDNSSVNSIRKTNVYFVDYEKNQIKLNFKDGIGAYEGDSGGPAFLEVNNELFLVGTCYGGDDPTENDHSDRGASYMNVSLFQDFIIQTAKRFKVSAPVFKNPNNN